MKQKYANYIIVLLYSNSLKKIKFYIAYANISLPNIISHTHTKRIFA